MIEVINKYFLIIKKFVTLLICIFLFQNKTYAATTLFTSLQTINSSFSTQITNTLEFLGLSGEYELNENFIITNDILFSLHKLNIVSLSLGYKINDKYSTHIEPYIFTGIDLFLSNNSLIFSPINSVYHLGLGINYGFDNTLIASLITKFYIGSPFTNTQSTFNTGTLGLSLRLGYRF